MTDSLNKKERSRVMARVRSKGNASTELKVLKLFRAHKITGWRRHLPLVGKPDFAFPKARVAVFIDGCFWHGCPTHLRLPASNTEYWQNKIARNVARDAKVTAELGERGWLVMRIWEHELKTPAQFVERIMALIGF